MHRYVRDNPKLAWKAVSAIERGDARELGNAMVAAQVRGVRGAGTEHGGAGLGAASFIMWRSSWRAAFQEGCTSLFVFFSSCCVLFNH